VTACGRPLPLLARPDRRYCSSTCRLIAFRRRQQAALAEAVLVGDIQQAGATDWRAAAFLLERHHPERWSLNGEPDELELLLEED
jgi:predicted nucleic acid-binding Zn ribbon protein